MSWTDNVRTCEPYTPGEQPNQPDMIKLNTNENPYPPSPEVFKAWQAFDPAKLRLYPDPTNGALVRAIAASYGLAEDQVFVGVGSDDVIAMLYLTFFNGDKPILFPDITYSFYDVWAEMLGIPYETIPLDERFQIRPGDYKRPNGGIVFANPNAPTGGVMDLDAIEEIVAANPDSVVICDEAYVDFGAVSALPLIGKYDNLIVAQTFSKSRSLAGLRIGFAMGDPVLIKYLNDVKYSFNSYTMNRPALEIGSAAVKDEAYFRACCGRIMKTRDKAEECFRELGFEFEKSASNFIFVTHPKKPAAEIFKALRERHIYVRYFNKPRINNHLRVTIGTDEQMEALFAALREILS